MKTLKGSHETESPAFHACACTVRMIRRVQRTNLRGDVYSTLIACAAEVELRQ